MNKSEIEIRIARLIKEIGEDPAREGLIGTPQRVADMYEELFAGYMNKPPAVTVFKNGKDNIHYDEMIIDSGDFYSMCEHHMMPFFGKYIFAYIPTRTGSILGLSKVARVVDHFSAKLQIQERLTAEIVEYLFKSLGTPPPVGMALIMKAEHLCKTMRGAKKKGMMTTSVLRGVFKKNLDARLELMNLVKL